jgi:hypothetical protein
MDQILIAFIFVLSILAGLASLAAPAWNILLAIYNYLRYLFSGPFKTKDKGKV